MKVLVTGATGYIGGRLVPRLLEAGHEVRVLVRDARRVRQRGWAERVEVWQGDLLEPDTLRGVAGGVDAAYYLVHSMSAGEQFELRDRQAALNLAAAAPDLPHLVYLGGLLPEGEGVSAHLRSRAEVGRLLRERLPTTEFRAGPIIGSGSASFEMVRYLTERLPAMVAPRWILNPVQPIAVRDVLAYLLLALQRAPSDVVEIGADRLTFRGMMLVYAEVQGLRRVIVPVPVLAPALAARWVGLVTPISNRLAVPLVEGVVHPVVADTTRAEELFPEVRPISYRDAVRLAIERVDSGEVKTRWSGALGDAPAVELDDWEGVMRERRVRQVRAAPEAVFRAFSGLGGERGWPAWDWAWELRGLVDRVFGGPGLRRGRRDPDELLIGEALDFWRVEELDPPHLLRLRAEMKVPGKAWLEFTATPAGDGTTTLEQTALFAPRGLQGALYWWSMYPAHRFIFSDMIDAIAGEAERRERG